MITACIFVGLLVGLVVPRGILTTSDAVASWRLDSSLSCRAPARHPLRRNRSGSAERLRPQRPGLCLLRVGVATSGVA